MRKYIIFIVISVIGIITIFLLMVMFLKPVPIEMIFEITDIEKNIEEAEKETRKFMEISPIEGPVHIGKQIEDYIEPINEWRNDSSFSDEEFNEYYKNYFAVKDEFQSNIVIDLDAFDFYFADYEWFKHLPEGGRPFHYNDFLWICYAIKTYFDGNVPHDYYVTSDDIYNKIYLNDESTIFHIFDVQIHGERPLHIRMDKFNYKILVEEGVQRINSDCEQYCCY